MSDNFDIVIIGAGIVGLSTAKELLERSSSLKIAVIDKEAEAGLHASGRNSGVMHCGIFYGSDTLKAKVCSKGATKIAEFAKEHGIAYNKSGKLIVATQEKELASIDKLLKNAADNQIKAIKVSSKEAKEIEPFAAEAVAAIHCPDTAVIDSKAALLKLVTILKDKGVTFLWNCPVLDIEGKNTLITSHGKISFGYLFNCAGAFSDRIAKLFGLASDYALLPFKGIYWKLSAETNNKIRANIYPVPDPALPFLGVHLTRIINGDVYLGPTAIPAFGRENYHGWQGVHPSELAYITATLASMYVRNQQNFRLLTHNEIGKYIKSHFYLSAKRLMPSLEINDMVRSPKVGIRPQLVNVKTKKLEMDYIFDATENSLHVLNTISPAFTSSFAFAEMIVEKSNAT